jgi:hypothetical protein
MSLWRRWKAEGFVYCFLLALCVSLPVMTVLHIFLDWPLWGRVIVLGILNAAAFYLFPYWRITPDDTARYLNKKMPGLEESCGLLLRPVAELGSLQQLQLARTEARLAVMRAPHPLRRRLLWAVVGLVAVSFLYVWMISIAVRKVIAPIKEVRVAEKVLPPGIRSVRIRITPPAYTGRAVRRQEAFNLRVEEGSQVDWEVETSRKVQALQFIFNDSARLGLSAANAEHSLWRLSRAAVRPGFYQVNLEGRLSELYTLEVVKDEPPHIAIAYPKPYTVVDYGEPTKIPLKVKLLDDYGIANAAIVATVASGNGEAVKFKEQTIRFNRSFSGDQPAMDLQQTLDLPTLGVKPGDELYFYCRAKDNHGQESRTDMYIISLPDTAKLMSMEGMTMSVDVKPEYFRSERQIIIEAEQLLKEKDTVAVEQFNRRSNDLGIDQKLLRLRYGKFLGEEAEDGQPGGDAVGKPGGAEGKPGAARGGRPGDFGDAATILEAYTDKHDNAEDATYFEPAVKEQLKATLSEMWKAELQLRTFKPREALPYAYKALRLLKDLQQKSRAYVAKTGVRVTPLDPAKRLGGKLDAISPLVQRPVDGALPVPEDALRIALALLERVGEGGRRSDGGPVGMPMMGSGSLLILRQAAQRLGREASARPGIYLEGYQAMRRILGEDADTAKRAEAGDVLSAQKAIRRLLPEAEATPVAGRAAADDGLSGLYFSHLSDPPGKP